VTFLFSEVDGSSRLAADLGQRYLPFLDIAQRKVRLAVADWGGADVELVG
jgi:hypothetical protein